MPHKATQTCSAPWLTLRRFTCIDKNISLLVLVLYSASPIIPRMGRGEWCMYTGWSTYRAYGFELNRTNTDTVYSLRHYSYTAGTQPRSCKLYFWISFRGYMNYCQHCWSSSSPNSPKYIADTHISLTSNNNNNNNKLLVINSYKDRLVFRRQLVIVGAVDCAQWCLGGR